LGLDLDDEIPNHSVLSKARRRWGSAAFEELFVETVQRCVGAGLVDGNKLHMDGTLINGNASRDSVKRGPEGLIEQLRQVYQAQEKKLDAPGIEGGCREQAAAPQNEGPGEEGSGDAGISVKTESAKNDLAAPAESEPEGGTRALVICSRRKIAVRRPAASEASMSTTDIDTAVVRKGAGDGARPRYKNHRAVDDQCGVITATITTSGDVSENTKLMDLVDQHEHNTGEVVETVVADAQYGTNDNFAACEQRGIESHMADLRRTYTNDQSHAVFGEDQFRYDAEKDQYQCPAGESLTRQREDRGYDVYAISKKICNACALRKQCTRSKNGRSLKRHRRHDLVEKARMRSYSHAARQDRRRRRHLMEGSFADGANNHGLKRARWRRLEHQQKQDYLIAACQNIRILMRYRRRPVPAVSMAATVTKLREFTIVRDGYPIHLGRTMPWSLGNRF
jgi:hypothetical protein